MAQTNSRFFSVMVVGENPQKLMEKYSVDYEVEPYVKYKYLNAKKYKETAIKALDKLLAESDKIGIPPRIKESLMERLEALKKLSSFEYYRQLTEGLYYNENGDALSSENPNAHWNTCHIGRNFSMPLKLKNGENSYSALSKDIDWDSMYNVNKTLYNAAWEMVMDGREPTNDTEKTVYESMKDKEAYFSKFNSKEEYVDYSTAYWNYAYVDENGWVDVDSYEGDETKWIQSFFENFVSKLKPNDLVTIFECSTNNG